MSHVSQVAHESPGTQRGQPDDAGLIAESCRALERFGVVFDRHAAAIHGYIARRLGWDAAGQVIGGVAILKSVLVSAPGMPLAALPPEYGQPVR